MVYDKLVRDKIPEIIEASGKLCRTRELKDPEEIAKYRKRKALEEIEELKQSIILDKGTDIWEELIDVVETVCYYLSGDCNDLSIETIKRRMHVKDNKNGKFDKNIILKEVL